MSRLHHDVQRALIRAVFDRGFAAALCGASGPVDGVSPEVARFFRHVDARALDTDPMRHARVLQAMLEDFRISATMAVAETRRFGMLEDFFASEDFARGLAERARLALAFGDYLLDAARRGVLTDPYVGEVIALERAQVVAKLAAPRREAATGLLRLSPGVSLLKVSAALRGIVAAVQAYLERIQLFPQYGLAEDAPRLSYPEAADGGRIGYLLVPGLSVGEAVTVEASEEACAIVQSIADAGGLSPSAAVRAAAASGIPAAEAGALLHALLACGALTGGPLAPES